MPSFKLPLSGDVTQAINPWTAVFRSFGGQFGFVNINLGRSSAPEVEQDILAEVGSYGRQLGRIGDAMAVLLAHFRPERPLSDDERRAIEALKAMLAEIDEIKAYHRAAAQVSAAGKA
ncbi:hypothetical protein [Polymorphum gilvum]|uniref:Uncharacterized protein n=1 Tax=Polymorphum gilvum (strain LMG 25793 / CGMCC 1.9160 / SL003B-26A1) TaxID=991905 RepID=F2IYI3_POLGS|nr:hypothetical protein [Polymorphum gilvum]ADZ68496.1 hypothetical protein SL003B_0057 [Polymorphum gilvum SL003B-26A1]